MLSPIISANYTATQLLKQFIRKFRNFKNFRERKNINKLTYIYATIKNGEK